MKRISVRKARIHNLKQINVDIPKGQLVVFTGVSGSGKSSLAFDLLAEEGRRRYLRSIGLNTGDEWGEEGEPFDSITGLPPTIAVAQNTIRQSNPRSVVGTKTQALALMCRLYAIVGERLDGTPSQMSPEMFAFNQVEGMCPECFGRGYVTKIDVQRLVPDQNWTLEKICKKQCAQPVLRQLPKLAEMSGFDWKKTQYRSLTETQRNAFLYGLPEGFSGLIPYIIRKMNGSLLQKILAEKRHCSQSTCFSCNGLRINEQARQIVVAGKNIGEMLQMTAAQLAIFLRTCLSCEPHPQPEGIRLMKSLNDICEQLAKVGLSYLNFTRSIPSLSGGELQRLYLMQHLQSDFDSLLYVFDEPTSGLHESEKSGLFQCLRELQESGNSVIAVEHDSRFILAADHVIEFGPGAGKNGGDLIYSGSPELFSHSKASTIASFLNPNRQEAIQRRVLSDATPRLTLREVKLHNLQSITVDVPLGMMVGVAGLSGSGKSTLLSALVTLLQYYFANEAENDSTDDDIDQVGRSIAELGVIEGWEHIKHCVTVTQAPIGRNRMSTPITYVGIWDKLRALFAEQTEAVKRGYSAAHFSFNTESGACPNCKGEGTITQDLGPLGHITRNCPVCEGTRYKAEILEIKYKGQSIYDVLNASVEDVIKWFGDHKSITVMLSTLMRVGLGYLSLGQPAPTLSGGEAQRIKLAKELGKSGKSGTLYVLDEPTAGLSGVDIDKLMSLLNELVSQGNTVIMTEHNGSVLSSCDWIIEMGPGGGEKGGNIITEGSPSMLLDNPRSLIGAYLQPNKHYVR